MGTIPMRFVPSTGGFQRVSGAELAYEITIPVRIIIT
jgi:hypothetical protein